jgi:hypothetical protein
MTQRAAVTFRASAEVLAAIDAYAAKEFCKRGEAIATILEKAVAQKFADAPAEPSKSASLKERSAEADLGVKEIRLAQLRKNLLTVDEAVQTVEKVFGEMKVEGTTLMEDLARDHDLNPDDLKRRFLECMAGPFGVSAEPFQRLADEFSKEPLP